MARYSPNQPKRGLPIPERFLNEVNAVEILNKCWLWTGFVSPSTGYAEILQTKGKGNIKAHRFSYAHFKGEIPKGYVVDHVCHNNDTTCLGGPSCLHRRCINPDHLEAKTLKENIIAASRRLMVCKLGHKMVDKNLSIGPTGTRICLECRRLRYRKNREKILIEKKEYYLKNRDQILLRRKAKKDFL